MVAEGVGLVAVVDDHDPGIPGARAGDERNGDRHTAPSGRDVKPDLLLHGPHRGGDVCPGPERGVVQDVDVHLRSNSSLSIFASTALNRSQSGGGGPRSIPSQSQKSLTSFSRTGSTSGNVSAAKDKSFQRTFTGTRSRQLRCRRMLRGTGEWH